MQSTELLICLWAVNMVHHWLCSRMVRADHSAQFDANLVYSELTLAEAHNAGLLKSQPPAEVDARWGYRRWRRIYTKSCLTVQRPSGYSTFHFILLIFHILAPAMLWPNASAWVAGIWMRVECTFTHLPGCQSEAALNNTPLPPQPHLCSPLPGSELACYREEQGGLKAKENRQKNPTNRSPGITNIQHLCGREVWLRGLDWFLMIRKNWHILGIVWQLTCVRHLPMYHI